MNIDVDTDKQGLRGFERRGGVDDRKELFYMLLRNNGTCPVDIPDIKRPLLLDYLMRWTGWDPKDPTYPGLGLGQEAEAETMPVRT